MCVGKANVKLPYSKITEYGISIDNLPDDITLKHPSSYGKAAMRKILAIKHQLQMTGNKCIYTYICSDILLVYIYLCSYTYHNNSQFAFNFHHGLLTYFLCSMQLQTVLRVQQQWQQQQ